MELLLQKHKDYLRAVQKKRDLFSYGKDIREHLAIPAAYWSITSLYLLKVELSETEKDELTEFVQFQSEPVTFHFHCTSFCPYISRICHAV